MVKLEVSNSPFSQEQAEFLNKLLPTLTDSQRVWLSGFLAASFSSPISGSAEVTKTLAPESLGKSVSKDVTILYGSQTGNAQRLAKNAGKVLGENGFNTNVLALNDFNPKQLKKVQNLLIVTSTHGEGTPPDNALTFHEFLHGKRAPNLESLQFSVLALGDSSYEFFCQTGKDFDKRLEELGGTRIYPRFDCDLDFEEPAGEWLAGVLSSLGDVQTSSTEQTGVLHSGTAVGNAAAALDSLESIYSRSNPFKAEVIENITLNGRGSNKETRHLEISLEGSDLSYKPGDSLGIYPENDPELVEKLLAELKWNPEQTVIVNKQNDIRSLKEALTSYYEITVLTKPLLEKAAALSTNQEFKDFLSYGNEEGIKDYIDGRDLLDLIIDFGRWGTSAQEFVSVLRKIPARLYSIASSIALNPDEVHLTIGAVRFESHGRKRKGVCSCYVADQLKAGDKVSVFIQENDNFKLPENPDTPIIMIGPGTGVAPFRSFMQEREEVGAQGKAWLFFGDQHFMTDFLYQTEWKKWLTDGLLTKMDVAFSRDTAEKVYVQHRILEHSKELFAWIEEGAAIYICGDEKRMAHDVHNTLLNIIETEGNMSQEQAKDYVKALQQEKRYQRDVY